MATLHVPPPTQAQELKKKSRLNSVKVILFGCIRLTLFQNRNTYNDDKKSLIRGFWRYWSTRRLLNYHVSAKV